MSKSLDKKRFFYLFMTLLTAATIFYGSTIKSTTGVETGINLSIFYHLGIFFAFTFFLFLTIQKGKIDIKTILITFIISIIYGISDEFHQFFVLGRFASVKDALIDCVGSLCAIILNIGQQKIKKV